ncbi:hypothetical protein JCGZ_19000 [Jatropha curcas]|uniref:Uncharacterized protein n=1 Tax=Jatropha curcas TaxID=180498 RepID=A0A067K6M2_JATCU|nr:uncharacterized protein LOC105643677 isoform X2 [Jatropha curcas]KDP27920.1 hypothetical protein JCGZ_19000 [Jatropha curcas]
MGRGRTKKTVTLEDYEHFLENPYDEAFSLDQLNERELYDALSTIDLIKPQRSTLKDEFSLYDSSVSLDQVKKDLEALNWQECAVRSIETIGQSQSDGGGDAVSKDLPVSSFTITRKRQRSKRKRSKKMRSIMDDGDAARSNIAIAADVDGAYDVGAGAGIAQYDSSIFVDTYSWEF